MKMVAGGPLAYPQSLVIGAGTTGIAWTATVNDDAPWIVLSAAKGVTPATITVSLLDWRSTGLTPGDYSGTITVTADGMTPAAIPVTLTTVPTLPYPEFTYISGPNGCVQPDGYPDAATCIVPNEKPPGNFTPPGPGQSYVDPNFGATVRVISPTGNLHIYSTPSAVSAGNKYVLSTNESGAFQLLSPTTGQILKPIGGLPNQAAFWDAFDSEVFYFPSGGTLMKWDMRVGKPAVFMDFSSSGFTNVRTGGTGDTSKDNWIAIWDAGGKAQTCAIDLTNVKSYCASYAGIPGPSLTSNAFIDFANMAKGIDKPTGKRYLLLMANPSFAVFSVNMTAGKLDFEYRGPEDPERNGNHDGICDAGEVCLGAPHSDTFEDSSGVQYLIAESDTQNPGQRGLATYQLNKGVKLRDPIELGGGKKVVMPLFLNGTDWTGEHFGCAKQAPYCVISTEAPNDLRSPTDQTPIARTPHITEVFVMRENGVEIRRLMQTRTSFFKTEDAQGYWSSPRACLSNDGTFVVADSNFGVPNAHRVLRIDTQFDNRPKIDANGVVNAASLKPALAPGALTAVRGSKLANCVAGADPGTQLSTSLCGSKIAFNNLPAMISYASPGLLNVIAPQALPLNSPVTVSLTREGSDTTASLALGSGVQAVAPAIFTYAAADGVARALIQNPDFSLNGPSGPAKLGEALVLYAAALGPTNPVVPDGAPAPGDPLAQISGTAVVFVNGAPQTVSFAGLTQGYWGTYQVNFTLDPATPLLGDGSDFVWLTVDGVESPHLPISIW